jgi:hypothetical protein
MFKVTAIWRKRVNGACAHVNNFLAVTLSLSPGVGGWLAIAEKLTSYPLCCCFPPQYAVCHYTPNSPNSQQENVGNASRTGWGNPGCHKRFLLVPQTQSNQNMR